MALLTDSLQRFEALQSDDDVKTDLELTCTDCGEVLCDIEAGDNLKVLAEIADEHVCSEDFPPELASKEQRERYQALVDNGVEHAAALRDARTW
jgi:hypothetical protein